MKKLTLYYCQGSRKQFIAAYNKQHAADQVGISTSCIYSVLHTHNNDKAYKKNLLN